MGVITAEEVGTHSDSLDTEVSYARQILNAFNFAAFPIAVPVVVLEIPLKTLETEFVDPNSKTINPSWAFALEICNSLRDILISPSHLRVSISFQNKKESREADKIGNVVYSVLQQVATKSDSSFVVNTEQLDLPEVDIELRITLRNQKAPYQFGFLEITATRISVNPALQEFSQFYQSALN